MTAIDVAKAQMEADTECLNCGREVHIATEDVEVCEVCCTHENTEDAGLLGEKCLDCGCQITED